MRRGWCLPGLPADPELPPSPPSPGKRPHETVSSGPLEAGSGQKECSHMTHLALDPLISAARSHLSPSLPEAQSFLPRQAGTPCVKRLQSRDRADVSPYSRGPALV